MQVRKPSMLILCVTMAIQPMMNVSCITSVATQATLAKQ